VVIQEINNVVVVVIVVAAAKIAKKYKLVKLLVTCIEERHIF